MMEALIAKLEVAPEGSRELDALVARAIGYAGYGALSDKRAAAAIKEADEENILTIPSVTTSIDAALTLVPEGQGFTIDFGCEETSSGFGWATVEELPVSWAFTPALALTIAALKAKSNE